MKTSVRTIILAAASIFAAMSCQKEESVPGAQDQIKAGETIQMNINASLGDFVSADGTKATAESVVRLKWAAGDKVAAYCGTTKISTGDNFTVTPSENGMFAKLTGEITTESLTSGTSVITFVYSNVANSAGAGEAPTFDFSTQTKDNGIPFVAYATLVYDGNAINNKMLGFKFATSVMKIAATNLGGGTISTVAIKGIKTKVTLTPDDDSETCGIAGSEPATISTDNFSSSSDGTRAIITVGLVPDDTSKPYRMLTVKQTENDYTNKGVITSDKIESSTSYTTPAALFTCGTLDSHDYVLIAGTKWATQNLAVSASGEAQWKSVFLPGTTTGDENKVQIGDYFQWGANAGYCGNASDDDKGLLIYKVFTNNGSSGSFTTWKKDVGGNNYKFDTSRISPYYESSAYQKYKTGDAGDGIVTLTPSDDVASILWSGTWRMPTAEEFKALTNATYWQWDGTDKGYYIYAPQSGDAGKKNNDSGVTGIYSDKSTALLFFPAAGYGNGTGLSDAGSYGNYWSSSLYTGLTGVAYYLRFASGNVYPQYSSSRYGGGSVRPVSD